MDLKYPTTLLLSDEEVNREFIEVFIKAGVYDCTDIERIMSKPFKKIDKKLLVVLYK